MKKHSSTSKCLVVLISNVAGNHYQGRAHCPSLFLYTTLYQLCWYFSGQTSVLVLQLSLDIGFVNMLVIHVYSYMFWGSRPMLAFLTTTSILSILWLQNP